jgi:hypothetical protein
MRHKPENHECPQTKVNQSYQEKYAQKQQHATSLNYAWTSEVNNFVARGIFYFLSS